MDGSGNGTAGASGAAHHHMGGSSVMTMTFAVGYSNFHVLWDWWHVTNEAVFAASFLAVVLMAVARRALNKWATRRAQQQYTGGPTFSMVASASAVALPRGRRLARNLELTAYTAVSTTLSYLLMLVAMTFNVGMFLAVVVGEALGFALTVRGVNSDGDAEPRLGATEDKDLEAGQVDTDPLQPTAAGAV